MGDIIERVKLGNSELTISQQGLGCMGMSEFFGPTEEEESLATLDRALELGINFLDTADMYGLGRNEELLGRAFWDRRDDVIIARKFTIERTDTAMIGINGTTEYVPPAPEAWLAWPQNNNPGICSG